MDIETLIERLRSGDRRALARALTLVENREAEAAAIVSSVFGGARTAKIVGLTGPPGVGKSTLADALAQESRRGGGDVAVLAVDPTSPFSGGALLGDRARMERSALDPGIFVRSMATRGHVGGLAGAAFEALVLLEAAGKDSIIVETVGAGQDEIEIAAAVDTTLVVLAPGLGDEIQASKAGILEIADILVVNKSDREGAGALAAELTTHASGTPVIRTVASSGEGVSELWAAVIAHRGQRRLAEAWLGGLLQQRVREKIPASVWIDVVRRVDDRSLTPDDATDLLLRSLSS